MPYTDPLKKLAYDKARYAANRDANLRRHAESYASNPEPAKRRAAAWRAANPERAAELDARYRVENRDRKNDANARYRAAHPEVAAAATSRYRATKDQRTASWDQELTDLVSIEAADLARLRAIHTGIKWHVDHVVPLRGRNVSGLHVWNNLAVIPADQNIRKSNRFCV